MGRSWLDVLTDLVDRVPAPRWAVYAGVAAAALLVTNTAFWIDGRTPLPEIDPVLVVGLGLTFPMLWSMQALDDVATRALATLRPQLDLDGDAIDVLAAELGRTPASWALAAAVVGIVAAVVSILSDPGSWELGPEASATEWWVIGLMSTAASVVVFGFLAHILHQLQLVDRLHRRHVRVDLFRLEPLYAFASLTARTGLTLLGISSVGLGLVVLIIPTVLLSAADVSSAAVLVGVAIACFVAPLISLHERIVAEKDRRVAEANETLSATLAELRRRVAVGELDEAAKLNDAVAAANASVLAVTRVSTWPWRPETLRAFAGAVVVPIGLWLVFELLRRLLPQ